MIVPRLAMGLWRGAPRWYAATAVVLAVALAVLQGVVGLIAGVEDATEDRTAAFYTDGLRVATGEGAAPSGRFMDSAAAARALGVEDHRAHYESQVILSRQGFVEAVLFEREGFDVDAPGRASGAPLTAGVVVGIENTTREREALAPYLVRGRLPVDQGTQGPVPLALSLQALERALTPAERAEMPWPPSPEDLQGLHFQVTAARLEGNRTLAERGELILRTGRVVGVFDTGVDVLDRFTVLAPIEAVRDLHGLDPLSPTANVLLVADPDPGLADEAQAQGWSTSSAAAFTRAQVGQLLDVLRWFGAIAAASLLVLPTFLVLHGLGRQLDAHRRELAVAQAIGVGPGVLARALLLLVLGVVLAASLLAPLLSWLMGDLLGPVLAARQGWPLPYGHTRGASLLLGSGALALVLGLAAWAGALRRRPDVAGVLRTG